MLPPSSSQPTPGSAGTQPVDGEQHTQSPEGEASDTSGTHRVVCHCDNQAVVAALGFRSCRDSHCMHLLRALVLEAQHAFRLRPVYIQSATIIFAFEGPSSRHGHTTPNSTRQSTPRPVPGLDLTNLASAVQRYFQHGLAPSTRRTYNSAMKRFTASVIATVYVTHSQ